MLRPTQLNHLNRPEITALFSVDRGAVLAFINQLLQAYDPMIRAVGHYSFVTDITSLGATLNKLRAYVMDAGYHRTLVPESQQPKDGPKVDEVKRTLQDWEVVTEALAAGLYPMTDRTYLSDVVVANTEVKLTRVMNDWMRASAQLTPEDLEYKPLMNASTFATADEIAFVRTALCFSWDTLIASGHLVNVAARAEGVSRGAYERLMRGLRIVGVQVALLLSCRTMALRPYAMLVKDGHIRERLIIKYGANARDFLDMLEEMANLPMHPWHAMADSLTQPGRNLTPWGATTPTMGVDQYVMKSLVAQEPTPENPVDPTETINWGKVFEYSRKMKAEVRVLREDPGLALDSAYTALRFTSVGPRPRIALMGSELTPVHTDGVLATEPLAPLDLLYRPLLPARVWNKPMRWIGEPRLMTQVDVTGENPHLYIEPEDVPVMSPYLLGRLSPSQLRSAEKWQGEDDALFTPGSIDGLANLFGVSNDEMLEEVGSPPKPGWKQYFDQSNGKIEPANPNSVFYTSSITRRPALNELPVNKYSVRELHALQYGFLVRREATRAQFVRDLDVPTPTYDVSEKLRQFAASLAGKAGK